jgi:hypothetical protein
MNKMSVMTCHWSFLTSANGAKADAAKPHDTVVGTTDWTSSRRALTGGHVVLVELKMVAPPQV